MKKENTSYITSDDLDEAFNQLTGGTNPNIRLKYGQYDTIDSKRLTL